MNPHLSNKATPRTFHRKEDAPVEDNRGRVSSEATLEFEIVFKIKLVLQDGCGKGT